MADLALVGAVRVHDPNLPVAGAIGYEIDFGAEQRCAAHLRYNIGREFVGRFLSSGLVRRDRKSTRLNSSHLVISYAVFCLKKKNNKKRSALMAIRSRQVSCMPPHGGRQ